MKSPDLVGYVFTVLQVCLVIALWLVCTLLTWAFLTWVFSAVT